MDKLLHIIFFILRNIATFFFLIVWQKLFLSHILITFNNLHIFKTCYHSYLPPTYHLNGWQLTKRIMLVVGLNPTPYDMS